MSIIEPQSLAISGESSPQFTCRDLVATLANAQTHAWVQRKERRAQMEEGDLG
jgi:hypothetical protein